ncbi:MAG: hypothetical protein ACI9NC_001747 [Verrucomicrobiales bacterium]
MTDGDLPDAIEVLREFSQPASGERRAMMQIIHDLAPGASQKFFTAFNGQADFANGIRALADADCDIIVYDIFFFAEPGLTAQAVNDVTANGAAYFSAAGNSDRQSYASEFRLATGFTGLSGGSLHDFDPGPEIDAFLDFTIPVGSSRIPFPTSSAPRRPHLTPPQSPLYSSKKQVAPVHVRLLTSTSFFARRPSKWAQLRSTMNQEPDSSMPKSL